jgi:SAM-dependent methyltransferase
VTVSLEDIIVCPSCYSGLRNGSSEYFCTNKSCRYFSRSFPIVRGQPALIDFDRSIFDRASYCIGKDESAIARDPNGRTLRSMLGKFLFGSNTIAAIKSTEILHRAKALAPSPLLLIIGGGTIGSGTQSLYQDNSVQVISTDVYASQHTHLLADAHYLPFASESFHAVWVQAVLEHVLDPHQVAAEINRILKPGGLLYADTPFMQQVHEEAYDFTRFTLNGHRWLFRRFEEIEAGVVAGAGTATLWSLRYLARALGFRRLASVIYAAFSWLRFLDGVAVPGGNADAASSVYFFGVKSGRELHPKEMLWYYRSHR